MMFHHLFIDPSRIAVDYESLPVVLGFSFEFEVALFCKLCVAIFAFMSGYGLAFLLPKYARATGAGGAGCFAKKAFSFYKSRFVKFYPKFWFIFIVFIPLGFALQAYHFSVKDVLLSFMGYSNVYNGEWCYVKQYVGMILLCPFLFPLVKKEENRGKAKAALMLIVAAFVSFAWSELVRIQASYTLILLLGMCFAEYGIFDRVQKCIKSENRPVFLLGAILVLLACFVLRSVLVSEPEFSWLDIVLVAPVIWSMVLLTEIEVIRKIVRVFGAHSTTIWLTHTFFAYYYFQEFIFLPGFSLLVFVWLCLVSLLAALALDSAFALLCKAFSRVRS